MDIFFLLILVLYIGYRVYNLGTEADDNSDKSIVKTTNANKVVAKLGKTKHLVEAKIIRSEALNKSEQDEFNKEIFLNGARKVFELVLGSFSKGELTLIKDLVSSKVFNALNDVLKFRKENNMTSEVDFICFDKSEIKEVKKLKNSIKVVVEFVSEQINLLKNADGEVIEGDENFVQKITDIWTFERSLNAKNNNWVLVSTKKTA